jgi:hypothetical protein
MSKKQKPVLSLVEESQEEFMAKMRAIAERLPEWALRELIEKMERLRDMPEAEFNRQAKAEAALRRKARLDRLKTARFGKIRLATTHPRA